jgi:hypothetical protein
MREGWPRGAAHRRPKIGRENLRPDGEENSLAESPIVTNQKGVRCRVRCTVVIVI